ncbi:hypothetical protein DPMN_188948 [Dreissena polymorpha]|uniref:Uncharacterized protein n=1 Tax=Dreissena polymorpha TaxID=45954 RepID=A0A9D4DUE0_DREPO|nr:hypothetical protein DPMN_188948 [Dreissena polymorpha]
MFVTIIIHSQCNLTGCDETHVRYIVSHTTVTKHLVLLVQQLDFLIIAVCNQDLPIWENTDCCDIAIACITSNFHIVGRLPLDSEYLVWIPLHGPCGLQF